MGEDDAHRSNSHSRLESSGGSSDGCSDGSSDGAAGCSDGAAGCSDGAAGCSDGCSDGGSDGGSRPGSLISEARDRDGCSHYRRKARPVAPCCSKVYACRFCHDDSEDHAMKRHDVKEMVCSYCDARQPMQQDCAHCGTRLGMYYCDVCRLHDDEEKGQFHCAECGICRSGGRDKYFHCAQCELCLPNSMKNNHKCLKGAGRSDCGVCLEDIHSARSGGQVLPCGHVLHVNCYREMVKHRLSTCPKCKVSIKNRKREWERMDDAIRRSVVPAEYRHSSIEVLCCDCRATAPTKYHIIGLKCSECGSYNTVPVGPLQRRDSKPLHTAILSGFRRLMALAH